MRNVSVSSSLSTTPPMSARITSPSRDSVSRRGRTTSRRINAQPMATRTATASRLWSASVDAPRPAIERPAEHRVDQPEGDAVQGADGQDEEAPEDGRMHDARRRVAEHAHLDDGVADERARPSLALVGDHGRPGTREDAQMARHLESEQGGRDEEQDRCERIERHMPHQLIHQGRRAEPASLGSGWTWVRPARVSSACASSGSTAASDSRAPRGLPGQRDDERRDRVPRRRTATGPRAASSAVLTRASPRRSPG